MRKKVARGVAWMIIQKWGVQLISLLVFIILARLLAPDAFGVIAMAAVFRSLVEVFINQGLAAAIVQRETIDHEHLNTAFWMNVIVSSLLAALSVVLSGSIAAVFGEPLLEPIIKWLSLTFVFTGLSGTQGALLRRNLRFRSLAVRSLIAATVGGVVGVSMAVAGFGVWSLVGQGLANRAADVVVLWRVSDWRPTFAFSRKHYRGLLNFGLSVLGVRILSWIANKLDRFVIGYYLGSVSLGYYFIGYQALKRVDAVIRGVVIAVGLPAFSRLQGNRERLSRAFYEATEYTMTVAFPVSVGLIVTAPDFMVGVFGDKWLPSVTVFRIFAAGSLAAVVNLLNIQFVMSRGKPQLLLRVRLISTSVAALATFLVVHRGIVAVATVNAVVNVALTPVFFLLVTRLHPIDVRGYWESVKGPCVGTLGMAAIVYSCRSFLAPLGVYPRLAVMVMVGAVSYLAIVRIVRPQTLAQMREMAVMVLPKGKKKPAGGGRDPR